MHQLRARVQWLSTYVNQALPPGGPSIESIETGTDLAGLLLLRVSPGATAPHGSSPASAASGGSDIVSRDDQAMPVHGGLGLGLGAALEGPPTSPPTQQQSMVPSASGSYPEGAQLGADGVGVVSPGLPADAAARRFVDAYFRNVNRAYPFVDRDKVMRDLEMLGDLAKRRCDPDSTLLYLITAIGCTTLQRAGQVPAGTGAKFQVDYPDIIQECLCREGVESVQILVLLALYSLFDPAGPPAWSLVGIIARQAMLLGLTRRSSDDKSLTPTEVELRHRLLWSIYVLDRMLATALGLPPALTDENMDVPLPGLTVDEFASPDRSQLANVLQTSRHVIRLRQMEGRILDQIHLPRQSKISSLAWSDRRSILQDIRSDIENWYSNGCLVSPLDPDNVPIHSSITWLSARYYYLLILLYYPCHFSSSGTAIPTAELLRFVQKHIQSTSVLFQQRQLPLNRVTLCRIFPVGLVLIYGFVAGAAEGAPFLARDEVTMLVNVLEAFPEGWLDARRAAQILRQFLSVASGMAGFGPLQYSGGAFMGGQIAGSLESVRNLVRPSLAGFVELMREVLGRSTCFTSVEMAEERSGGGGGGGLGIDSSPTIAAGLGRDPMACMSAVMGGEGPDMSLSWSELDFL